MASPAKSVPRAKRAPARSVKPASKERVLLEFPAASLRRAGQAARAQGISRSEFIRLAVEARLEELDVAAFERELAEACVANNDRNLALLKDFAHVDGEGWQALP